ncbi:hypothetical protein JCM10207_008668 [Rhodosporidiobolus poonsookiae]
MEWANLVSTVRKTRGDVPPALVGASVTLVGDSLYVFGGRPVDERGMVSSLYSLDLRNLLWTLHSASSSDPSPRYFHSATAWGDKLVIFGGQRYVPAPASNGEEGHLETLDELLVFNTTTQQWSFPSPACRPGVQPPSPRYAHLGVISTVSHPPAPGYPSDCATSSSRLLIIGGQDYENNYISDLAVLDLERLAWVDQAQFPRKAGSYRSVGAAAATSVHPGHESDGMDGVLLHSSYGEPASEEEPEPVLVFSNTNFSNPRRDLDLIPSVHDSLTTPAYLSLADSFSASTPLPPGLRFPHAYICGRHLVVSGSHVGVNRASFVFWALDLGAQGAVGAGKREKLAWTQLPVEKVLGTGSWGPSLGWRNTLVVCGDGKRDMMADYNSRQVNFSSVAFVDLEGFGIYVPPARPLEPTQQALGLLTLSQPQLFDYTVVCSDKERLGCSRQLLEARWSWFRDELAAVEAKATAAIEAREQRSTVKSGAYGDDTSDDEPIDTMQRVGGARRREASGSLPSAPVRAPSRLFPITAHTLELPLAASEVKALLQYFHTLALSTPLQRELAVLSSLLAFTKNYEGLLPELRALVIHALHESLTDDTAARVYQAAALGGAVPLQIRASQVMLASRSSSHSQSQDSLAPPPARYSDHSQSSSHYSAESGHTSPSSLPSTPASSVYSPTTHSYLSQPPPCPTPPLPVTSGAPFCNAPPRNGSLSPTSELPYAASSQSSHGSASTAQYPPPRPPPSSAPPTMPIANTVPARIAEAFLAGEERDRRQRAEAARLAAETSFSKLNLGSRKGSITPSFGSSERRDSDASMFAFGATERITGMTLPRDGDNASIKTASSSGNSNSTKASAERAAAAAQAAAQAAGAATKVVKKGFLSGILAQPTLHAQKGGATATGPPPRRVYPAPRTRKEVEDAKKAAKLASDSGSSKGSFRS